MIPTQAFCDGISEHQVSLFRAFDDRRGQQLTEPQIFLAEWHRRCRKTTVALNLEIRECCRWPKGKYGHIAPTQVQARNIIWDDPNMLRAYLPDQNEVSWSVNEQKMLVTFHYRWAKEGDKWFKSPLNSVLKIGGSDDPDAWRGTDFVGITLDEFALMKPNLWFEILRPVIGGPLPEKVKKYQPFRWALCLYTPKGINHATMMFDEACCLAEGGTLPDCGVAERLRPNFWASRVDGEKSGIYTTQELARMRHEMSQSFYDQEIKCSRVTSEQMTLITTEMLYRLNERLSGTVVPFADVRRIVSIDPAFGGDVCRIMGIENGKIVDGDSIRDKQNTAAIVMAAKVVAKKIETKNFIVDSIGNGLGVADGLAVDEANYHVQYFVGSEKPTVDAPKSDLQFANKRAEAYFYAAERIRKLETAPIESSELLRGLPFASRYTIQSTGRLIIQPKEKIRDLLQRSPDDEDCYDDQTEVYTDHGWRYFKDVTILNKVLSMDLDDESVSYQPVQKIINKPYKGKMCLYDRQGLSFCVTPTHNMVVKSYRKPSRGPVKRKFRTKRSTEQYRLAPLSEIKTKSFCMKRGYTWVGEERSEIDLRCYYTGQKTQFKGKSYTFQMDQWAEFLGWFISEGCVFYRSKPKTYWVSIGQSQSANQENCQEIHDLLSSMGLSTYYNGKEYRFGSKAIAQHLERHCLVGAKNKRVPVYLKQLTSRQIRLFLDAFRKGDGYINPSNGLSIYCTSSKKLADDIQELIIKTGGYASIRVRDDVGKRAYIKDHWATTQNKTYLITEYAKYTDAYVKCEDIREIDYDNHVYCVNVLPHHTLYIRRNGYPCWCGNCYVMGIWGLQNVLAEGTKSVWPANEYSRRNAMC